MGLITINRNTDLDKLINFAAKQFNPIKISEFRNSLNSEVLECVPDLSDCAFSIAIDEIEKAVYELDIKLGTYRSRNPWTKTRAYTTGLNIMFNSKKEHDLRSIIITIGHELTHIASGRSRFEFNHGVGRFANFNQDQKQGCAPQLMGRLFAEFAINKGASHAA